MEVLDLNYYYIARAPIQFLDAALFLFRNIFILTFSYSPTYIFMHEKSYTTI